MKTRKILVQVSERWDYPSFITVYRGNKMYWYKYTPLRHKKLNRLFNYQWERISYLWFKHVYTFIPYKDCEK